MHTKLAFKLLLPIAMIGCFAGTARAQYLPANVAQPGDTTIASSDNSPGTEGVANAIDGTQNKYLNFDTRNPNNPPSGFIVIPSVGPTWVTGLAIQSANDAPERDPHRMTLEGSNDTITNYTSGNWTLIADVTIPYFTNRYQIQTVYFTNFAAYKSYRWVSVQVATNNGCCMQVAEVQFLGVALPKNVAQPGDHVSASSDNSPGTEGVANAIDGTQNKYLNFDTRTPNNPPSGFAVTPSVGATLINGISIQSANDAPERDPKSIVLEGSNDVGPAAYSAGTWETIYVNTNIPVFAGRYAFQTFLFPNVKPYLSYRWTVMQVQTNNGCCMQVAEVQFLGAGAPQNILIPGDTTSASSDNSPGTEGVANAIDGTQNKYLNFDTRNPNNPPSGFAVLPSVGSTLVIGMAIQSANDAPERDPHHILLEGSNDPGFPGYSSGNWTSIADVTLPYFTNRYQFQSVYFPNQNPYKYYRWTSLAVSTNNGCCMQVAEVQLLAVTAKADCSKAAFVSAPTDTPVLSGSRATFFSAVNGPWPLQWYTNGVPVPGANKTSFTTGPVTAANAGIVYQIAITGCQTSTPIHAVLFTPSTTASIGVKFSGGQANGAPTYIDASQIAGVQPQAYWINVTNRVNNGNVNSGTTGDQNALPDTLNDSSNHVSGITMDFSTSGNWGAGVGTDTPAQQLLNGLVGQTGPGNAQTIGFHQVPAGNYSLLVYSVSPPLQFQTVAFSVNDGPTNYQRTLNADEYKVSPGFYRSTSTDANNPGVGNFIRFDNLSPNAFGDIILSFNVLTPGSGTTRETGVNAVQLLINPPNVGNPPVITQQPQPTVAPTNGVASLSVVATGNGLTYQWRKNGATLSNGGHISGANSSALTISQFNVADEGIYSVAIFNQAGSTVSKNAVVKLSAYNIRNALVGYWKFDETTGTNAANSVVGGLPASIYGDVPVWGPGQVAGALSYDSFSTYGFVSNYPKATKAISGSAWVNVPTATFGGTDMAVMRNASSTLRTDGGQGTVHGQFQFDLSAVNDPITGVPSLVPYAAIGLGPNIASAKATATVPLDSWHHVAFTADGAQLRVYLDGAEVANTDYLADINPPDVPWISIGAGLLNDTNNPPAQPDTNPAMFAGKTDEMALWTRALSADEITKLFQAGTAHSSLTNIVEVPPLTNPIVTVSRGNGTITVTWDHGTLTTAPTVNGPWTDQPLATSPFTEPTTGAAKYYRAH
jgi:hypothetical protein